MPRKQAVAYLMCFSPSLFRRREFCIDENSVAVRNPKSFEFQLPDDLDQEIRTTDDLFPGHLESVYRLLENPMVGG
jgi:hypothetical protein